MLFVNGSVLVVHSAADMQMIRDQLARVETQFSLEIIIKKTERMYQPLKLLHSPHQSDLIMINRQPLAQDTIFAYPGSTVSNIDKF